jgi:acetyl esterase/lipase
MTLTLAYGADPDQVADVVLPTGTTPAPLVLFLHGGFWRAAHDRAHVTHLVEDLSQRGYAVANVEYRRTGAGGGFPETLLDVALAADRLPGLIEAALPGRVDRDRIVYSGHSAGGHLAVWAALRDRLPDGAPGQTDTPAQVAGVLALAPVLDLAEAYRTGGGNGAVREFLGAGPQEAPDRYAAADPAAIGKAGVPVTIVHGDQDELVPPAMSRQYAAATGAKLVEPERTSHFDLIDTASAAWPVVLAKLAALTAGR